MSTLTMPPAGYESFLRAICQNPADDAPRLVYADWLDEHGDPDRAEFIRAQIARAAAQAKGEDVTGRLERERVLREKFEIRWRCELPVLSGVNWQRFWRGFVSGADFLSGRWFLRYADGACAVAPLQFIRLLGHLSDHHMPRIADSPALRRIESLTFFDPGGISSIGWRDFVSSRYLRALRSLHIVRRSRGSFGPYNPEPVLDPDGARHLVASPALSGLRELVVQGPLEDSAIDILRERFGQGFRYGFGH